MRREKENDLVTPLYVFGEAGKLLFQDCVVNALEASHHAGTRISELFNGIIN